MTYEPLKTMQPARQRVAKFVNLHELVWYALAWLDVHDLYVEASGECNYVWKVSRN